jgi:phosphate:Na+ symporter
MTPQINYYVMFTELIGGLALFIWGMQMMGDGLQKAAGDKLRYILEKMTRWPVLGAVVGTGVTAIVQSSSAVTVMLVGFVNANLMTLAQAMGVIFGANIGTTITAQLIAFKIDWIIYPAIFFGVLFKLFATKKTIRVTGEVLLGFGVLFLGMKILSMSVAEIKQLDIVANAMASLSSNIFVAILAGAAFTAIIQSSSATSGLVLALVSQGLITFPAAIGLMLGANIGTCVTALLASIGGNVSARRVAVAHTLFNVFGVVIFIPIVYTVVTPFVEWLTKAMNGDLQRQVANFHTVFNLTMTIIMLPITAYYVKFIKWLVPGQEKVIEFGTKFISPKILSTPSLALEQATQEIVRMYGIAREMVTMTNDLVFRRDKKLIKNILDNESNVDSLQISITKYLTTLTQKSLSEDQAIRAVVLLNAVHDVERIGDHATNISELGEGMLDSNVSFTKDASDKLQLMFETVEKACTLVMGALREYDADLAASMKQIENDIDYMAVTARDEHFDRLRLEECKPENGIFYLDIVANLERIGDHCYNISRAVSDRGVMNRGVEVG